MVIVKILLGLVGLGIVVFMHELGHFLAAKLVGIEVEAFSIGWGKPILKKIAGGVEYRLGLFPIGGYCKMRGENELQEAWANRRNHIEPVKGTYYGAHPLRRIVVAIAGPLFNLLFAVLVFSVTWGLGFEVNTLDNRVILVSDIAPEEGTWPADRAGLITGDRIISINGTSTATYNDIQSLIAVNPDKTLAVTVDRDGRTLELAVTPELDRSSGAGRIGVYFWTDPVVDRVEEGSPAALAGLESGDRIRAVNGQPLPHTLALSVLTETRPATLSVEVERDGLIVNTALTPLYGEDGMAETGITWQAIRYHTPPLSPPEALAKGAVETWKTFVVSVQSLALLFRGIDLTQAVSGPARITYMAGDIATAGFGQSVGTGLRSLANFLALISIALGVMNLLPLPVLDGGLIVFFLIETVIHRPPHPRVVYAFQLAGVVLIAGLMLFAVFGDILFFVRR